MNCCLLLPMNILEVSIKKTLILSNLEMKLLYSELADRLYNEPYWRRKYTSRASFETVLSRKIAYLVKKGDVIHENPTHKQHIYCINKKNRQKILNEILFKDFFQNLNTLKEFTELFSKHSVNMAEQVKDMVVKEFEENAKKLQVPTETKIPEVFGPMFFNTIEKPLTEAVRDLYESFCRFKNIDSSSHMLIIRENQVHFVPLKELKEYTNLVSFLDLYFPPTTDEYRVLRFPGSSRCTYYLEKDQKEP